MDAVARTRVNHLRITARDLQRAKRAMTDVVSMGTRRYALEIQAPLTPRFKMRLERAVTHAITSPTRALPTLRRAVMAAMAELRVQNFTDDQIRALLAQLIEDVARDRALDGTSIVSGHPRWMDLIARVMAWTQAAPVTDVSETPRTI